MVTSSRYYLFIVFARLATYGCKRMSKLGGMDAIVLPEVPTA